MNLWLETRRALVAMDTVMKSWGLEIGLNSAEVLVLMFLREKPGRSCAELATLSGRQRQNVQTTLRDLVVMGVLEVTRVSPKGKVLGWGPTAKGHAMAAHLKERMELWEQMLGGAQLLGEFTARLDQFVRQLVDRPYGGRGWRSGLMTPEELRRYPGWKDELLKSMVRKELAAARAAAARSSSAEDLS